MAKLVASPFSFFQDSAVITAQAQAQAIYNDSLESLFPEKISAQAHSLRHEILIRGADTIALADSLWQKITPVSAVSSILLLLTLYFAVIIIYRLYLHPLAKFPGPRIAAITRSYEFWYQGIKCTEFPEKIKEMHQKYGPIVRISPEELSLNDSRFNAEYFGKDRKLDKDPWYYGFGFTDSLFTLLDKVRHKDRQTHLAAHFSGPYFNSAGPMIGREVQELVSAFEHSANESESLNVSIAYRKLANEILKTFLLGESAAAATKAKDYGKDADAAYHPLFRAISWIRHFPILYNVHKMIPGEFFELFLPVVNYQRNTESRIRSLIKDYDKNEGSEKNNALLYRLIEHDPTYRDRNATAATEEYMELHWGGREVIGHALTNINYHLMANPQCMEKLHDELTHTSLELTTAPYGRLQQLPYLRSVCKEGIRMQLGGRFRIPRVNKDAVQYKQWVIPPMTPVSMCPNFFHDDEEIFEDAMCFKPERWLQPGAEALETYWRPFGNGSRGCAGRNMAMEVIHRAVANVVSKYRTDFDGIDADFCMTEGMMKVFPRSDSQGLTVSVTKY